MPDIYGNYNLSEAAGKLGVTAAWINRVQRETGIGGNIGTKGREASFDEGTLKVLQRIKVLRLINFSFAEIKAIYELEKEIDAIDDFLTGSTNVNKDRPMLPFILHPLQFTVVDTTRIEIDFSKKVDLQEQEINKDIIKSEKLIGQLWNIAREIRRRKKVFMEGVEEVDKTITAIIEKYPDMAAS